MTNISEYHFSNGVEIDFYEMLNNVLIDIPEKIKVNAHRLVIRRTVSKPYQYIVYRLFSDNTIESLFTGTLESAVAYANSQMSIFQPYREPFTYAPGPETWGEHGMLANR